MSQLVSQNSTACEVCGGQPPLGHLICDECWPQRAIEVGRAGVCAECSKPRLVEKLVQRSDGLMVCQNHQKS